MNSAEECFYLHLKDIESIRFIMNQGINEDHLPTVGLHPVWRFAKTYSTSVNLTQAPSIDAFRSEMGDLMSDLDLDMDQDPEDTIEWAIDHLKSNRLYRDFSEWTKTSVADIASQPDSEDRRAAIEQHSLDLQRMIGQSRSQASRLDVREHTQRVFSDYHRKILEGQTPGASMGIAEVDVHTHGIKDGELVVLAGAPKTGKSFGLAWIALSNWRQGRSVVLFTLENSPDMTIERIACMAAGVDSRAWQRGSLDETSLRRVEAWIGELTDPDAEAQFMIMQPDIGQRGFDQMVVEARLGGADLILVDQLTFVELEGTARQSRHERIGASLHTLKAMISTGRDPIPCILAHQINREGQKLAQKNGYVEMYHLAEASEVERTADWVFALHASRDDVQVEQLKFQTLASRRETNRHWQLNWRPANGDISVIRQITNLDG